MKVIVRERETGKARQLVEYAAENNAIIAAENPDAFRVKAAAYGFSDIEVVDWQYIMTDDCYLSHRDFVIHNADKFLQRVCGKHLIGYTATLEDK